MSDLPRLLVVDDDRAMCELVAAGLRGRATVTWRTSAEEAFQLVLAEDFDVVVTDIRMGATDGLTLTQRIVENRPDVSVIVITAFGTLEMAIATVRAGAADFLPKPFELDQLTLAVYRAVERRHLRREVLRLRDLVGPRGDVDGIIGESERIREVLALVERVADAEIPILITGESGSGKELIARAVHTRSRRSAGPFVAVNCAALPENLLESELFGHVRGAFTDARQARRGLFLEASGGTLFLDEIGEMPPPLQAKLLRALETRQVRPVGGSAEVAFSVNLVTATNRDLEGAVADKRFREDLYYRINVVHIALPALRQRGSDVLLLAQHFLVRAAARSGKAVKSLSPPVARKLLEYAWPGNVRELQNCIDRAVALARFDEVVVDDLPERVRSYETRHVLIASDDPTDLVPMEEVERRYILRVMEACGGQRSSAARILGYDRKTLYRRLTSYGYEGPEAASGSSFPAVVPLAPGSVRPR